MIHTPINNQFAFHKFLDLSTCYGIDIDVVVLPDTITCSKGNAQIMQFLLC